MKNVLQLKKALEKKIKKGFRGYPIATIALYGPTNKLATKIVVGIIVSQNDEVEQMRKWYCNTEIRSNLKVMQEILDFIKECNVCSVAMVDKIIGCPHEEGINYPDKTCCPQCPYWANRDRFTDEQIH
ncbi:MAG: hypothetical protein A3F46_05420 [Legionellales bacterium RIFCSPHIGHO2_12_FULL_42_9]|nr:MAG: hypothetical protein A3F46_05420 [Legionellales bacterium RIFCSPHIGHO2_12_FULL_42_9]